MAVVAAAAGMFSCSDHADAPHEMSYVKGITMMAEDFYYDSASKVGVNVTPEKVEFAWEKGDKIGVFATTGNQVVFTLNKLGSDVRTALFDGGAWALKSPYKYSAYSPYINDYGFERNEVPAVYGGQIQVGNANTDHIARFDYMAAKAESPEEGVVLFKFRHLGALIELELPVSRLDENSNVSLSAASPVFVVKGTFDLSAERVEVIPHADGQSTSLNLTVKEIECDNEDVKLYMMVAPVDLSGQTLKVNLQVDGQKKNYSFAGRKLEAGKAYRVRAE